MNSEQVRLLTVTTIVVVAVLVVGMIVLAAMKGVRDERVAIITAPDPIAAGCALRVTEEMLCERLLKKEK